ncbi:MAG: molybdopterin-dependent oxidoreductase [Chloroflexi bacterium]|nr:molybdopterin-dependent oxidoreductase [Chloroflexota bacterium]
MQRVRLLMGALVGVLLTAPLMALLYLGEQAAGLPFPPFDLFDWLARTLPGDVIGKSIEVMVDTIREFDLGETSSAAKRIETLSGLLMFFGGGVAAGAVLFWGLARLKNLTGAARYLSGIVIAALLGIPAILISLKMGVYDTSTTTSVFWLALAFFVWGAALGWSYDRLYPAEFETIPIQTSAPVSAMKINRREFIIRVGSSTATLTILGAGVGYYLEYAEEKSYRDQIRKNRQAAAATASKLPNQNDPVIPAPGTRAEYTPLEDHYRIDINVRPAEIDAASWRLNIKGLVDHPLALSIDDLMNNYEPMDQYVTLACISNSVGGDLTSTTLWTGACLQDVLADAGLQPKAAHLKITSSDGFYETVALDLVNSERRVMLAYHWDGIPLLYEHGYPLRIYIPDRYGMKQPKWITDIEVIEHDEEGYWVERGWDKVAQMRATSVVDVAASDSLFEQDGVTYVPVGGIAHAGARGISKVEVKVDDGEWAEARLRSPLSDTTWVIWRYDWPFSDGRHVFEVRCYEGDGTPQIAERQSSHPSGATGIDRLSRNM